ncbi:hypothetical protein HDU67_001294 [Dinochytrium kinnereticum]|nr:hypothetical protein HDU67_001294 [Dinochytrium kinnereticum]
MVKIAASSGIVVFAVAVTAIPLKDFTTTINAIPACVKTWMSCNGVTLPTMTEAAAAANICQAVARLSDLIVSGKVSTCISDDPACISNAGNVPSYVTGVVSACSALSGSLGITETAGISAAATKPSSAGSSSSYFSPLAPREQKKGPQETRRETLSNTNVTLILKVMGPGSLPENFFDVMPFSCNGVVTDRLGWENCEHRLWATRFDDESEVEQAAALLGPTSDSELYEPKVGWYWSHRMLPDLWDPKGRGNVRTCVKVESQHVFHDWDTPISPIFGRGFSVTFSKGRTITEGWTAKVEAGLGIASPFSFSLTVGYSYTKSWTTDDSMKINAPPVSKARGIYVVNKLTSRWNGFMQVVHNSASDPWGRDPCYAPTDITRLTNVDRLYDGPYGLVRGEYHLCESDSYPLPYCVGNGIHWG